MAYSGGADLVFAGGLSEPDHHLLILSHNFRERDVLPALSAVADAAADCRAAHRDAPRGMYVIEYVLSMKRTKSNQAARTLGRVLEDSGLTKTALCSRAGISRALFDDYLHGRKQPSLAQIERIADAAGFRATVTLAKKPRPVSAEYVAVMELADQLAGTQSGRPELAFPYQVWRTRPPEVAHLRSAPNPLSGGGGIRDA